MEELVRPKTVEELEAEYKRNLEAKKAFDEKRRAAEAEKRRREKMIFFLDWPSDVKYSFFKRVFAALGISFTAVLVFENFPLKIVIILFSLIFLFISIVSFDRILRKKLYRNAIVCVESISAHSALNFIPVLAVYDVELTLKFEDSDEYIKTEIQTRNKKEFQPQCCYDCKILDGEIFSKKLIKM